ncbi:MAG: integrating conjugative element protein [Rhodocyclaceae bacterium]|nr:integrating conjugative element protein [Rhodocyclaceae bacterium]
MRPSTQLIALLLAMCAPAATAAPKSLAALTALPPVLIHDAGGVSLAPYLANDPTEPDPQAQRPLPTTLGPMLELSTYPVASRRGAPGRLLKNPTRGQIQGGPGQPFFIVGDDALSHEWLRINATQLRKMGAYGILTSVQSADRLRFMVDTLQIPMAPISADSLFEALGFAVWPVLVGPDGSISQ